MSKDKLIPETPSGADYRRADQSGPVPDVNEPLALFRTWLAEARESEPNDPNAMALSTVDADGLPDVRMVLLKDVSADGLVFFTHETSAKGEQMTANPKAALLFHWKSRRRQVRVRGRVEAASDAAADAYFASRARVSRIGAWASDQSQPLENRAVLEARLAEMEARFGAEGEVPRPPTWRGYCIVPDVFEFWQDQPFRLHDRLVLTRTDNGWTRGRLNP